MREPVAREHTSGIEPALLGDELGQARVAADRLLCRRPPVVRQVVAAAELDRAIDQAAEVGGGSVDAVGRVVHVQVEDDARPALARPGEDRLVVFLDDADGAVDDVGAVLAGVAANRAP